MWLGERLFSFYSCSLDLMTGRYGVFNYRHGRLLPYDEAVR